MRYLDLAHKLTTHSHAKQQRMAAVIVRGGSVLSAAWNHGWNHAEQRAIRPWHDYTGATLYVMRHNGRCSRPCNDCQKLIIKAGIKKVVYIAADGYTIAQEVYRD